MCEFYSAGEAQFILQWIRGDELPKKEAVALLAEILSKLTAEISA
jgi:hypothetical protein